MLTDLGRFIAEIISFIWPFHIVYQWERGAYYVCGRYWREVGPGCWPKLPWFMEVKSEGIVSQTFVTPLQTITTRDGGTLTFSASVKLRVVSISSSYNNVLNWDETALEDACASLSEKLSTVEVARLEPEGRGRLIAACKATLDPELKEYGLVIDRLRFNNFVRNMPVYRLFNDQGFSSHA